jgi:pSer/pThr/pTyr-binding forkhead associated (FHA) protein
MATIGLPIRLTVMRGADAGHCYELRLDHKATIGRWGGCDVAVESDDELSGRHCELALINGRLMIADLQSTNGTLVNGVPVKGPCRVESGDTLTIGQTELRISY